MKLKLKRYQPHMLWVYFYMLQINWLESWDGLAWIRWQSLFSFIIHHLRLTPHPFRCWSRDWFDDRFRVVVSNFVLFGSMGINQSSYIGFLKCRNACKTRNSFKCGFESLKISKYRRFLHFIICFRSVDRWWYKTHTWYDVFFFECSPSNIDEPIDLVNNISKHFRYCEIRNILSNQIDLFDASINKHQHNIYIIIVNSFLFVITHRSDIWWGGLLNQQWNFGNFSVQL